MDIYGPGVTHPEDTVDFQHEEVGQQKDQIRGRARVITVQDAFVFVFGLKSSVKKVSRSEFREHLLPPWVSGGGGLVGSVRFVM